MSDRGRIELERSLGSIVVGERHRRDPGDLTTLVDSMKRVGLLQPVTITPDGYLICGYRRLEAAKQLGWSTLRVWVRSGISDDLTKLLAERDENLTHKPLSAIESAHLFEEMKALLQEDADRRMKANQFKAENHETAGHPGRPESGQPESPTGRTSRQAALLVTQKASHNRLEQILAIERVAADRDLPKDVRQVADDEIAAIRNGGAVDPSYQRVMAAKRVAEMMKPGAQAALDDAADEALKQAQEDRRRRVKENRARREAEAANTKRSTRSFNLRWAELDGWSSKYAPEQIAREIKPDDWTLFIRVVDETRAFADAVHRLRGPVGTPEL
ncbi:MAG: ParB/RepB/Spo0J family partition protein [Nocardioides sp.]|uniref:ParB N-terminal domain-containing protein n=1 Tax=Nocardioides sp. TaxID=35761 RepID=UPI0039E5FAD0